MCKRMIEELQIKLSAETGLRVSYTERNDVDGVKSLGFIFSNEKNPISPIVNFGETEFDGLSVEQCIAELLKRFQSLPEYALSSINVLEDKVWVLAHVRRCLCSTQTNLEFLDGVPYRQFADISVYYKAYMEAEDGVYSYTIDNDWANHLGLTVEELECASAKNTTPEEFVTMSVLSVLTEADPTASEVAELPLYLITSKKGTEGASSVLSQFVFESLAAKLEDDLYAMARSKYELVVMPATNASPSLFRSIVQAASAGDLTNSVFRYVRESKSVEKIHF